MTDVIVSKLARPVLFVVLVSLVAAIGASTGLANERPNIVFLLADDQRLDTMQTYGNAIMQTPNLDELARQGTVFDSAFVTTSICCTNRACIITGQYAARHKILDFKTQLTPRQLAQTYAGAMKQAGYHIGFIGKWGVGSPPQGFYDYNKGWPGQNKYYHTIDGRKRHLTEMMGDQALEYLDIAAKQEKPFCLAFSFKAPHVYDPDKEFMFQYDPALKDLYKDVTVPQPKLSDPAFFAALPSYLRESENRTRWEQRFSTPEKYQKNVRDYWRLISGVDVQVGRIRTHLEQLGLDKNTIIVFSSDHGFYLGERGFAGKWYAHELSIRIPLVVLDPRTPGAGSRRDAVALSIDIAPTILDLAGVPIPKEMQGHSLRPILDGNTPDDWQTEFFYEHNLGIKTIPKSEGVRTPKWKYMVFHEATPVYEELYDLEKDPDEANNLAVSTKHQSILRELRVKHAKWRQRVK